MGAWSFIAPRLAPQSAAGCDAALRRAPGARQHGGGSAECARGGAGAIVGEALSGERPAGMQMREEAICRLKLRCRTLGESIVEATVGRWLKHEGEHGRGRRAAGRVGDRQGQHRGRRRPSAGVLATDRQARGRHRRHRRGAGADQRGTAHPAQAQSAPATRSRRLHSTEQRRRHSLPSSRPSPNAPAGESRQTARARRPWRAAWPPSTASISGRSAGTGTGGQVTQDDVEAYLAGTHRPPRPPHLRCALAGGVHQPGTACRAASQRSRDADASGEHGARSACGCRGGGRPSRAGWSRRSTPRRC